MHIGVGTSAAPDLETALVGLCRALDVSEVLIWDAPRAIGALRAMRDLPSPPVVSAHIGPARGVAWDELNVMAIRGRNVIDNYVAEDHRTADELDRFRLGRHIRLTPVTSVTPGVEVRQAAPWTIVTGATWRGIEASPGRQAPPGGRVRTFAEVMWDLLTGAVTVGSFAFPDPDLASAAPIEALREQGCGVNVAGGSIEKRLLKAGIAGPLPGWCG
jgi:hypothetical protein